MTQPDDPQQRQNRLSSFGEKWPAWNTGAAV